MGIKTVYWSPMLHARDENNWSILFIEPQSVFNKFIDDNKNTPESRTTGVKKCPAFTNLTKNTFYIENPMETDLEFENGKVTFKKQGLFYELNGNNLAYSLSYAFFCEDDLELLMTTPYFSEAKHQQYAITVPGRFNISRWFRPFNVELMLINDKDKFKIAENEHIAYFTFLTDDKVVLQRFEVNDTIRKVAKTCSSVDSWWRKIPLPKRYERFLKTKTNRLILTEIKKQLVQ